MAERQPASRRLPLKSPLSAKRVPANQSVSLRHGPVDSGAEQLSLQRLTQKQSQEPYSTRANPPSTLSSKPAYTKDSSGESSNAERWFETNNNNVRRMSPSFLNDEPPFLLRNGSSEDSPSVLPSASINPTSLPYRTTVLPLTTVASSSEDYRSVIDDLTVQNKKLKRRLKKYERVTDPRLQEEKLFEVRVHGLPVSKKKELEDMLKKFVMSCDDEQERKTSSRSGRDRGSLPRENKQKSSSHTSTRFGDSAYASASGRNSSAPGLPIGLYSQPSGLSNQHSVSQSGLSSNTSSRHQNPYRPPMLQSHMSQSQQQSIQSYLHDIPAGLLPKATAMTEKSKKKLVVRRLESIFAGKVPIGAGHQQPLQQQEVSQLAARADRRAMEANGQRFPEEGAREAQFIVRRQDSQLGQHDTRTESTRSGQTKSDAHVDENDFALHKGAIASEQRPTRPLDLDPYRAQIPEDNIKYIRHLGFSPQNYGATSPLQDGHGWIYVNLLINMAQLHTLNVTSDFVRKAISDISTKLEVSNDGRKLRWKGGVELTRTSSNGSPDDDYKAGSDSRHGANARGDLRKLGKLANSASNDGSSEAFTKSVQTSSRDKFAYTPLFSHKQESEDDEEMTDDEEDSWSSPRRNLGDSSGFASSGMKTTSSRKKRGDDGPIIFYNKANFCTDLSGDARGKQLFVTNNNNYSRMQTIPLGSEGDASSSSVREAEKRGPFSWPRPPIPEESMDIDSTSGEVSIHFDQTARSADDATDGSASVRSSDPVHFEASGIGGVIPVDNFAIRVKARQQVAPTKTQQQTKLGNLPPKLRKGLDYKQAVSAVKAKAQPSTRVRHQVISERRKDLPPSELPPPSYYPLTSPEDDSEEESGSESDEEMSDALIHAAASVPSVAPQPMLSQASSDYGSDETESEESEEIDDDDDDDATDGIDLLAHARLIDPASIQAREREYDCEMAERLAEEIPAGSSAATAGGGSGFNSPASHRGDPNDISRGVLPKMTPNLKRSRTHDSLTLAGPRRPNKSPKMSIERDVDEDGSIRS